MTEELNKPEDDTDGPNTEKKVNRLVKRQVIALIVCGVLMVFGFLAIAINLRYIMSLEHPLLAVVIAQIPAAIGGAWLGLELMWAGRREGLSEDAPPAD